MKRVLLIVLLISFCLLPYAQNKKQRKLNGKATTTKVAKSKIIKNTVYTNSSIRGLQNQRAAIQKKIREQEAELRANKENVKQRLQNLLVINSEIDQKQKSIDGIQSDIHHIEGNIGILKSQLKTLEQQLQDRKAKYIKSMRYMSRHHSVQDKLMFIFSAKSFAQMYRRFRFIRQYAAFQKAQGDMVKAKQEEVTGKHVELEKVKGHKNSLLTESKRARTELEGKKTEQQDVVKTLQSQQKTIQNIIAEQHKKDAALNAQIDRLIAQEVAKARARAAAEAKKRAAAAEAAKRRAAELAKKKAAAEAAARENARRIAEAKAREAKLKAEAEAARKAAEAAKRAQAAAAEAKKIAAAEAATKAAAAREAAAAQAAREAQVAREAAERKAKADEVRTKKEIAEAKEEAREAESLSSVDRMMNSGFEANRGRLPMPITGSYRIVSHFGQHSVDGLNGVTLDNKGINIMGHAGCNARAIYDGEVSAVFGYSGTWVVMVRHGAYISVYCNLKSVAVHRGQRVSARQGLGSVGADNILQFQLRKETAKLNPEAWLGR